MEAKVKADWIAALRSGQYEQCDRALERNGKFCCLGVLCKVVGYEIQPERDRIVPPDGIVAASDYGALENLGLGGPMRSPLIAMNDTGKSFAEIADYIEREIP